MRLILLLLSGCISAHDDTADTAPDSVPAQDSEFCVDWCPDVDGDGLGAPDLACAPVCLPPGSVPDPSACTYVANCSDPEPMVAGHSKPVLALTRWKFRARPNLDGDPYWMRADCDDSDPTVHPGATEIAYDGKDNDCNPLTLDADADGDGVSTEDDCNDADPARWLWYCYDDDKDGVGDLDSPMPRVCGSVALHPPDADYHPCPESP